MGALAAVAKPALHLVRGVSVTERAMEAVSAKVESAAFGQLRFGYVKEDYRKPDPEAAIQVTAKWTCPSGDTSHLEELTNW